jgi:hypothetical protein
VGRGRRRFAPGQKVGRSRRPRRPRARSARPQHCRTRGSLRDWRPRRLNDENGKLLPGVAQVAIQQGDWVAETIARDLQNQPRRKFHYHDKGSLATIGRAAAVAQFGKFEMSGYFAWLAWLFIHILFLIGFRNRLLVMIQWAWSYLTYERSACLITGSADLPGWIQPNSPPQSEEVSPEKNRTVPVIPAVHGATGVSPAGQRRA